MKTAKEILEIHWVDYSAPLEKARVWRSTGEAKWKNEAADLLKGLRERFPEALEIGQELGLVLFELKRMARSLLDRRQSWSHDLPDDDIWHLATVADCHLLSKQWAQAARLYGIAQEDELCPRFHVDSMRRNAERNLNCLRRIGEKDVGPFADLDAVFPPQTISPGPAQADDVEQSPTDQADG